MYINDNVFTAIIIFFVVALALFATQIVAKFRLWSFNESVFKTNKKTMLNFLIFFIAFIIFSLIVLILVQVEVIIVGEFATNKEGIRINVDDTKYNIIRSKESILSFLFLISAIFPALMTIYYLTQIKVHQEITNKELLEFAKIVTINFEEAEKSYYILRTGKRGSIGHNVVFDKYISVSEFFANFNKKLMYKRIIKKTISFVLCQPNKLPTFDQDNNIKNIVMVYLITAVKVINKSIKEKITLDDLAKHLLGITF
ncbi:hypothetical protein [Mycoplasmopsis bovirhinis]|uniref:Uncharacterized protein n=1 Tax=Mycoplasmopsis bovirhinis TaxID=29553 RepID=A0A449AE69_9BACT|nr:hypothetical protein [Mycoplasmopsis bovirhinis]VEU63288.1 Uncharacterised protein [Mycoplasmopsis bovirhinis]